MQYELHKGLHRSKRTEAATLSQLVRKIQRQADTNAGRFLSSRSAWDTMSPGPGVVEIVISGQGLTQLAYHLYLEKADRSLNSFAMLRKNVC